MCITGGREQGKVRKYKQRDLDEPEVVQTKLAKY